jgi:hypothetical protein
METIKFLTFGVILVLLTLYIIFYVIYPGSNSEDLLKVMTPLNSKKNVVMPDVTQTKILGSSGSTVMGFFYLNMGDRTSSYVDKYTSLMEVDNNWYIEISPAPKGKDLISTRLRVQTNDSGIFKQEIIELPAIPKQKWVFIAILREGRRFDVIYDNKIVVSQRLENYPVIISSPLSVGNSGLDGSVIHIIINDRRLAPSEVERERVKFVDTNNTVLEANKISMSLPNIRLLAQCPPGLPCDAITKPPGNNLLEWESPYA